MILLMLEEGAVSMDKKSRQSSVPPKSGPSSDSKKNESNSPNRFGKYGRKRESGTPRGGPSDVSRRNGPNPQKCRTAGDKRPRSRGYHNDRQREEVAEPLGPEYGSPLFKAGSKKASLNHLLNFTFAPRETNFSSYSGGRRFLRSSGRVYNKERFLQANCQFVVGDGGDYIIHSVDADTLVAWDLVEQVRTLSHEKPTCPICLQEPLAGKITRCGHIFCWACILHYLQLGEKSWRKCPICYDSIETADLKSVQIRVVHEFQPGETITLRLMKRERGSTYYVPKSQWMQRKGVPHNIDDAIDTEFVKILVASPAQIQETIIEPEKLALKKHMETAEDSEVCFIESAVVLLKAREESVRMREMTHRSIAVAEEVQQPKELPSAEVSNSSTKSPLRKYVSAFSDKEDSDEECAGNEENLEDATEELEVEDLTLSELDDSTVTLNSSVSESCQDASVEVDSSCLTSEQHPSESSTSSTSPSTLESSDQTQPAAAAGVHVAIDEKGDAPSVELPTKDVKKRDQPKPVHFYFQANDGQHVYVHSLNARCLMKEYGSLENCPETITAVILDIDRIFMTEDLRKRLRHLNHLPLSCEFQVAELTLTPPLISKQTLKVFADDFEKRKRMRQRKLRDEKKRSRKIEAEENAKNGKFPEMKISLSSFQQFPTADLAAHVPVSASARPESPSLSSVASSPPASPASGTDGLSVLSGAGSEGQSDGELSSMSFAQMLRAGKSKPQPALAWPMVKESTPVKSPGAAAAAVSDESDNEDRVPVPVYQDSFSSAIQAALDTRGKMKGPGPHGGGGGKKKKQKFTKLFATSMTRGK